MRRLTAAPASAPKPPPHTPCPVIRGAWTKPASETFDDHQHHARIAYLEGDPPRASIAPFVAWLVFAFMCGVLITLALSAAMSAADRARFRTPASMAVSGVAAVRVGSHARSLEDPSPASDAEAGPAPNGTSSSSFTTTARDDPARNLATERAR